MTWVAVGTTVASGFLSSRGAKKAKKAQEAAAGEAIRVQGAAKEESITQLQPYASAGQSAMKAMLGMQGLPGGTPFNIEQDPSYQFRMNQSMKALETSAAARGGLLSGGFASKALKLAGDFASTEYTNIYNRLNSIAQIGMHASGNIANVNSSYAANVGNIMTGKGDAQASGYVAQGNILADLASSAGTMDWSSFGKKTSMSNQPGAKPIPDWRNNIEWLK